MRFRKLRIAWSVGCGIACVLLIVLWVRSYWWVDQLYVRISTNHDAVFQSVRGEMTLDTRTRRYVIGKVFRSIDLGPKRMLVIPYWFLAPLTLALAGVPWFRWSTKFSLRTLLITMTLVAVVLGLIVWRSR